MDQPTPEDHLEAAKLAKLISGGLNMIDQFSVERKGGPSNRIDMNNFIHKVSSSARGEQQQNNPNYNPNNPDNLALPIDEDLIRRMVPDPTPNAGNLHDQNVDFMQVFPGSQRPIIQNQSIPHLNDGTGQQIEKKQKKIVSEEEITRKDFLKLVKSVDKISTMLELLIATLENQNVFTNTTTTS